MTVTYKKIKSAAPTKLFYGFKSMDTNAYALYSGSNFGIQIEVKIDGITATSFVINFHS